MSGHETLAEVLRLAYLGRTRPNAHEIAAHAVLGSDWLAARDARVAATARADALTEAADALNVEGLSFKPGGWGSNPADQQTLDALLMAVNWLYTRAATEDPS